MPEAGVKVCTKCLTEKPLSAFAWRDSARTTKKSHCRACWNLWRQGHRLQNPDRLTTYSRENMQRRGLSLTEYNEMLENQEHGCAICGGPANGNGRFHIDHDHNTGSIRGLLCHSCNTGLGLFKDDPDRLISAVAYLLEHCSDDVDMANVATEFIPVGASPQKER